MFNNLSEYQNVPSWTNVPILMYHHVGMLPSGANAIRTDLTVSPVDFEAHLQFLADNHFQAIHIADLISYWLAGSPLPQKPVLLTFDDGYDDNYGHAFPLLKRFGFTGTFFIVTQKPDVRSDIYMTWEQINQLAEHGMEIGSHTVTHKFKLGRIPAALQLQEIQGSFNAIKTRYPKMPPVFCYPCGSYNVETIEIVHRLGYIAAVTTRPGLSHNFTARYELSRVRIHRTTSIPELSKLVEPPR